MLKLDTWSSLPRKLFNTPNPQLLFLSIAFFPFFFPSPLISHQVVCTKRSADPQSSAPASTSAASNPPWLPLPLHTPRPLHGLTSIHQHPLLSSPHPHTCPLHWQSHIIHFCGDTGPPACVCHYLITIEQKQALTGGTRQAALMSVPGAPLFFVLFCFYFPRKRQIAYT